MCKRYYHPGWGRWTQPDPIYSPIDPKLWNPYTYVGNDPINHVDPTGTVPVGCTIVNVLTGFLPCSFGASHGGVIIAGSWGVMAGGARAYVLARGLGASKFAASAIGGGRFLLPAHSRQSWALGG